jgi:hypothetical protein
MIKLAPTTVRKRERCISLPGPREHLGQIVEPVDQDTDYFALVLIRPFTISMLAVRMMRRCRSNKPQSMPSIRWHVLPRPARGD